MNQSSLRLIPAEIFAAETQATRQCVINRILDGHLNGVIQDREWYVLEFEEEEDNSPELYDTVLFSYPPGSGDYSLIRTCGVIRPYRVVESGDTQKCS